MTLEKNTLLQNRYRIVEILGQGGMGSVYRAVDENLGATVALKENLFTTDEYARQFRLEAVILANLRHPNLPRVYDHFVVGEEGQYLVMDYIEGEDLRQRMDRMGTIPEDEAIQIGAAICDALAYLHTRKPPILHRDIKPGNVKITPDGHIYLVDFGLAKVYQGTNQATTTGARAMTPGYSPPEQYGTARTDSRTDMYSLGATLYAALTGVIPEDGLARAMDNADLTPLRKRNPKISRRLAAAIEKAMGVDPSDRFQTAEEFKQALLGTKSKTQQVPGGYTVAPPPAEAVFHKNMDDADNSAENSSPHPPAVPITPSPILQPQEEEKPFVSPLKRQKERERKRRKRVGCFIFILLLLALLSVPFFVPGVLPANILPANILPENIRNMVPFLVPISTSTPTITPSPIPTQTSTPTFTATVPSPTGTWTPRPTNSPTPIITLSTATLTLTVTVTTSPTVTVTTPPSETPTLTASPTSTGGGYGQIAYASDSTGLPQIYIADLTSQTTVQVTDMAEGACQPSWSPDGEKLVFISPCKGMDDVYYDAGLYIVNADGSNLTPISTMPGGDFDPAWSPDGKSIAFSSLRTGQMEIFVLDVKNQTVTQLTKGTSGVESRQPAWSPDGTQIVYTVKRYGVYQIWLMNADGTQQNQIIRSGVTFSDYLPTWSPDGKVILFNQRCATTFCLPYLMLTSATDRSDQQGQRMQLNVLPVEDVSYSPDGFWLAFEGEAANQNKDVFIMTVTGANRTRITTDKGLDFNPAWRPINK